MLPEVVRNSDLARSAHLASLELLVVGEIEHIHHELGYGLLSNPEEDVLTILDQEQSMSFQPLARQIEGWWKDHAILADRSGLSRIQEEVDCVSARSHLRYSLERQAELTSAGIL